MRKIQVINVQKLFTFSRSFNVINVRTASKCPRPLCAKGNFRFITLLLHICSAFKWIQRRVQNSWFLAVGRSWTFDWGNSAVWPLSLPLGELVTLSLISDPGASLRSRGSWSCYRQSDLDPVATVGARVEQRCLCILGLDPEPRFWMDGIRLKKEQKDWWCPFYK